MCKRCSDPTECGSFISAVKCFDCGSDRVLPVDSLDYDSTWRCGRCGYSLAPRAVEQVVGENDFVSIDFCKVSKNVPSVKPAALSSLNL